MGLLGPRRGRLELFSEVLQRIVDGESNVSGVQSQLDTSWSTVYSVLEDMRELGLVVRNPETKVYSATEKGRRLHELLLPVSIFLEELEAECKESVGTSGSKNL